MARLPMARLPMALPIGLASRVQAQNSDIETASARAPNGRLRAAVPLAMRSRRSQGELGENGGIFDTIVFSQQHRLGDNQR
jgi:hypothetical protein